ncbi:DUF3846 domain-containing protein [Glutamicibacter ardleyensis]|uniref:DUF3846 domain-containing protein n=1 Tax=Glutamicibacter ardleyensis TaxID=225894 RepID=UPI003FD4B301
MAKTIHALKITDTGAIEPIQIDSEKPFETIYKETDSSIIEFIYLQEHLGMTVDEEGKPRGKEPNITATQLANKLKVGSRPNVELVGHIALVAFDAKGNLTSLNGAQKDLLSNLITS